MRKFLKWLFPFIAELEKENRGLKDRIQDKNATIVEAAELLKSQRKRFFNEKTRLRVEIEILKDRLQPTKQEEGVK